MTMKKQFEATGNPQTFGEQLLFWLMANPNKPLLIMRVGDTVHVEDGLDDGEPDHRPPHSG